MLDRLTIGHMQARAGDSPIAVALSGGGDSTALLHALAQCFGVSRLHAIVVDHALRDGSAGDAQRAEASACLIGVSAETITLSWAADAKRSQQSARMARYRALCSAAKQRGACVIALGHTADDQAETVFMRAAAGSGWRGLAGMAPVAPAPVWPEGLGLIVARPMLGVRRGDLRAWLRSRGAAWVEDPANANLDYERVRVRARLAALEDGGFDPMRLVRLAERLRPIADALDREAAALIARAASFEADRIVLARKLWDAAVAVRRRGLSALIAAASGAERQPAVDAVDRLDARLIQDAFAGASLGGATLSVAKNDIVLGRDRGAIEGRADGTPPLPALALETGVEAVWDGRLLLRALVPGVTVHADHPKPRLVGADGKDASAVVEKRWLLAEHAAHLLEAGAGVVSEGST